MKTITPFAALILVVVAMSPASVSPVPLPPNVIVVRNDTALRQENGIWMLHGRKFSGYIVEMDSLTQVAKLPVIDGRENGVAYGWYPDGHRKYERRFLNGNRHGIHRGWYENDTLAFIYYFKDDRYEGVQKSFFANGQPWQCLHYRDGYEEGKQKSWNEQGRVINNFTVKNGKLYGVVGRYDCISVIHQ